MFGPKDSKELAELRDSSNNIGKGTVLDGDIQTYGNIRIEGKVVGNIRSKSKVVLSETGSIEGNLLAQNAEVAGEVKGAVEVSEILILKPSAVIHGDIVTNKLVIESGANFNGSCKMGAVVKDITIESNPRKEEQEKSA